MTSHYIEELEWLDEAKPCLHANLDANLPNQHGRLPLHSLCATAWYDLPDTWERGTFLRHLAEKLISKTENIDAADAHGVRPLHLASMMSEWLVKRLLAAGADPTAATSEGLTALHLAARARAANIVGLLIQELKKAPGDLQRYLDAPDQTGRSAIFHACRSGRPESVELLLEAGASVDLVDEDGLSPLDACTEYEQEQTLWEQSLKPQLQEIDLIKVQCVIPPKGWNRIAEGGVRLRDTSRPWVNIHLILMPSICEYMDCAFEDDDPDEGWPQDYDSFQARRIRSEQDTTRLEEIIDMLCKEHSKQGTDLATLEKRINANIERCRVAGSYYSMRCFQSLKLDSQMGLLGKAEHDALLEHDTQVLSACAANPSLGTEPNEYLVEYLLRRREYRVIERLLRTSLTSPKDARGILLVLVKHGFARLLEIMLTETDPFHGKSLEHMFDPKWSWDPPVLVACQRELPNLHVVRLLVKRGHADINAHGRTGECEWEEDIERLFLQDGIRRVAGQNTALHEAAKGCHWWHVEQAIPFLLSAGADRQRPNDEGETPLGLALHWERRFGDEPETFAPEARALLQGN
ncbi:hypothetical protein KJ359_011464 [Pestalotiopsis sp. 9143b]|nr:hypothetical protein KJ359_011464 [Pestalotiopsis sp. 9143b]